MKKIILTLVLALSVVSAVRVSTRTAEARTIEEAHRTTIRSEFVCENDGHYEYGGDDVKKSIWSN